MPTNTLDELMSRLTSKDYEDIMNKDPLLCEPRDIDGIIAYHRKNRANVAAGIKPAKESGPKVKIDGLVADMLAAKPKVEAGTIIKRRI